ncbi:hypothetical protein BJX66DRAFT_330284 [Aspergillus keveii]|uniref:Uncharacterized protein n=1 Tax=Aspergillus keveii TaxID=714993 RepID=A0ABR4FLQ5_9EURO
MAKDRLREENFIKKIGRLSTQFDDDLSSLDEDQEESVRLCCELFHDRALESVSTAQKYRILRVRKLFRKVYSQLGPAVFILCALVCAITELSKLDQQVLLPKLRRCTLEQENTPIDVQQNRDEGKQSPLVLTVDNVPGLQHYQSTRPNPQQLATILGLLQNYQASCPSLQHLQLIIPWYGALPYIDIRIDSKIGWSAKVQLSLMLAVELRQYVCNSWVTATEASDGGIA